MSIHILALAALVPLVVGFVWYGPLFKNAWMKEMGFTEESLKGGNMLLIFGLCYVFSFFIAMMLQFNVVHQTGVFSTLAGEPGFTENTGEAYSYFTDFMKTYGDRFRTLKHGALHGALTGGLFVMPILAIIAMFERRSVKYVAINAGYWIVTLAIMGAILGKYMMYN